MGDAEAAALLQRTLNETVSIDRLLGVLSRTLIHRGRPGAFPGRGPGIVAALVRPAAVAVIGSALLALVTGMIDDAGRR